MDVAENALAVFVDAANMTPFAPLLVPAAPAIMTATLARLAIYLRGAPGKSRGREPVDDGPAVSVPRALRPPPTPRDVARQGEDDEMASADERGLSDDDDSNDGDSDAALSDVDDDSLSHASVDEAEFAAWSDGGGEHALGSQGRSVVDVLVRY